MNPIEDATTIERMLIRQASTGRTPINGSLELLPLCNMNCDMCYVRLTREEMEAQGRLRTLEEWLQVGHEMKEAGVLFLLLTGGEPLLYPWFKELYKELQKMGMIITINTNGTLIDEEMASFLGEYKPRRINITLYGTDNETYEKLCHYPNGYDKVVRGIKLLKKNGVDVKVSSSLTPMNQNQMNEIIAFGEFLDVPVRVDTYMMPAERERNKPFNQQSRVNPEDAARIRMEVLEREMGENLFRQYCEKVLVEVEEYGKEGEHPLSMSCLAGKASFTINWQGEMRPCVILSQPSRSVFECGFKDAWRYIVEETDKILLNSKCSVCKYHPLCRTCAACALLETGEYGKIPDYMCRYAEESLRILQEKI